MTLSREQLIASHAQFEADLDLMIALAGQERVQRLFQLAALRHLEMARVLLPDRWSEFVVQLEEEIRGVELNG